MKKAWIYIRSTPKTPPSKQRPRIQEYLSKNGLTPAGEEVERSGSKGFPAFKRVLEKAGDQLIVISNMGQMVRTVGFMELLTQSSNFVVLDQHHCRPDTLSTLTLAARELAKAHKLRVNDAVAKMRAQGVPLGSHRPGATAGAEALRRCAGKGSKIAAKLRSQQTEAFYRDITQIVVKLRKQGWTFQEIANELNDADFITQTGGLFYDVTVMKIAKRWENKNGKIKDGVRPGPRKTRIEFPFLHGPYGPPDVTVGDTIKDHSTRKNVKVAEILDGWPVRKDGNLILAGGLVLAVCGESTNTICTHWDVTPDVVRAWKEAMAGRARNIKQVLEARCKEVEKHVNLRSV